MGEMGELYIFPDKPTYFRTKVCIICVRGMPHDSHADHRCNPWLFRRLKGFYVIFYGQHAVLMPVIKCNMCRCILGFITWRVVTRCMQQHQTLAGFQTGPNDMIGSCLLHIYTQLG